MGDIHAWDRCGDPSETGLRCVMQPDHGGDMHCGGVPLKWWDRDTGTMVDFTARLGAVRPRRYPSATAGPTDTTRRGAQDARSDARRPVRVLLPASRRRASKVTDEK